MTYHDGSESISEAEWQAEYEAETNYEDPDWRNDRHWEMAARSMRTFCRTLEDARSRDLYPNEVNRLERCVEAIRLAQRRLGLT